MLNFRRNGVRELNFSAQARLGCLQPPHDAWRQNVPPHDGEVARRILAARLLDEPRGAGEAGA